MSRAFRAWAAVAVCTAAILATVPVARAIQRPVAERFGREAFTVGVVLALFAAAALLASRLRRSNVRPAGYAWLGAVMLVYLAATWSLRDNPEEAVHFLEYGLLALLAYRAAAVHLADAGAYLVAALVGLLVGVVDEGLQWLMPERVWQLRDVGLNLVAAVLALIAIATALRPARTAARPSARSLVWASRLGLVLLAILLLCAHNTPSRIDWYSQLVPGLAYLRTNETVMVEYGYLIDDPGLGRFRSRFRAEALRALDEHRAAEMARILDRYRDEERYGEFLRTYTPVTDPLVHEARVHLFRRDRHLARSKEPERSEDLRASSATIAWREDRFMRSYFPRTTARSSYGLSETDRRWIERYHRESEDYESAVSNDLITCTGPAGASAVLLAAMACLVLVHEAARRRVSDTLRVSDTFGDTLGGRA